MKESKEIKAYRKAKAQLEKLRDKAEERRQKDIEKAALDYIVVKGNECRTEADIDELFGMDLISSGERDKALDKLEEQLNCQKDVKSEAYYLTEAYELALDAVKNELFGLLNDVAER